MQACGWVSKIKAAFAVASFHDSPAKFLKPAWCSSLVSCPIVVSTYRSTSHCLNVSRESLTFLFLHG